VLPQRVDHKQRCGYTQGPRLFLLCCTSERKSTLKGKGSEQSEREDKKVRFTKEELTRLSQLVRAELLIDEQKPLELLEQAQLLSNANFPGQGKPIQVNVDLGLFRARRAAQRGRLDQARFWYLRCLEWNVREGRAWLGLARLAERVNNIALARRFFRYGVRCADATTAVSSQAHEFTDPDTPRTSDGSGLTHDSTETSSELLGKSHKTSSRSSQPGVNVHLLQAWAVMEESVGDIDRARRLLRSAVRAAPSHTASWVAFAMLEYRQGNDGMALERIMEANRSDPQNYFAWHVRGIIEWRAFRRYELARQAFEKSLALNPSNSATYHAYACMECWALNNVRRARELFDIALREANPRNRFVLQSWALMEAEKAKDLKAARALFAKGTQAHPRDAALWQSWALVEARRARDLQTARKLFTAALHADPQHLATWQAWAMVEADTANGGDGMDLARRLFQRGIWASPESPDIGRIWHAWATAEFVYAQDLDRARRCCQLGLEADERSQGQYGGGDLDDKEGIWRGEVSAFGNIGSETSLQNFMVETEGIQDLPVSASRSSYLQRQRQRTRSGVAQMLQRGSDRIRATPMLYALLGQIEALSGDLAASRACFEKAVALDPGNANFWQAYESVERDYGDGVSAACIVNQRGLIAMGLLEKSKARIRQVTSANLAQSTNVSAGGKPTEERLLAANEIQIQLSEPQAGDYASTGTWIEFQDLLRLTHLEMTRWFRRGSGNES
jgi:tetratricopeptide (TPR) repeat protein